MLLGHHYIASIITSFYEVYPQLRIDLRLTHHVIDLYLQGFDIAIRIDKLPDSNLIAKQFAINQRILVATPEYLAQQEALIQPKQFTNHQCLLFSYPNYRQDQ